MCANLSTFSYAWFHLHLWGCSRTCNAYKRKLKKIGERLLSAQPTLYTVCMCCVEAQHQTQQFNTALRVYRGRVMSQSSAVCLLGMPAKLEALQWQGAIYLVSHDIHLVQRAIMVYELL